MNVKTTQNKLTFSRYGLGRKLWPVHLFYLKGNLLGWRMTDNFLFSTHFCLFQTLSTQSQNCIVYLLHDDAVKICLRKHTFTVKHCDHQFSLLLLYMNLFCCKTFVKLMVISILQNMAFPNYMKFLESFHLSVKIKK